jgi:hypothetical protein
MAKAPIYKERGANPATGKITQLWEVVDKLQEICPNELHNQLVGAINDLIDSCEAKSAVKRGTSIVGFGVDKAQKAIECDKAIAILKQIKAIKAW